MQACRPCLADQLTLFQPGGTDYAHLITTGTPRFLDLPTALVRSYAKAYDKISTNDNIALKLMEILSALDSLSK